MKSTFNIYNTSLYAKHKYTISEQSNINISFRYDSYRTINDLYYKSSYSTDPYEYQERIIKDDNIGWNLLFNKNLNPTGDKRLKFSGSDCNADIRFPFLYYLVSIKKGDHN